MKIVFMDDLLSLSISSVADVLQQRACFTGFLVFFWFRSVSHKQVWQFLLVEQRRNFSASTPYSRRKILSSRLFFHYTLLCPFDDFRLFLLYAAVTNRQSIAECRIRHKFFHVGDTGGKITAIVFRKLRRFIGPPCHLDFPPLFLNIIFTVTLSQ